MLTKEVDLIVAFSLDEKNSSNRRSQPHFTFPHNTKRVFADYTHMVAVPSPDAYFKHDGKRREDRNEYGLSFDAT